MLLPLARPLVSGYMAALSSQPLLTNCVTASSLSVLSDAVAQAADPTVRSWDPERAAAIAVWGLLVSGLMLAQWFKLLNYLFPNASTSLAALVGKVALNQAVMSPGLNGGFFSFVVLTREKPKLRMPKPKRQMLIRKIKADLPGTIARSCGYWSVVQAINFRLLPPALTQLWTNLAFVVWSAYISYIGFKRAPKPPSN